MPAIKSFCLLLLMAFCIHHAAAQGFLKAKGTEIVNAKGENVLLRGIGLGGWMLQEGYMLGLYNGGQQYVIRQRMAALIGRQKTEAFYNAWLSNFTRRIDIDSLKAWGFNSVRLPMHYNLYTLPVEQESIAGHQTWLKKGFAITDSLLAWCKANHLYLILDLHATPGGQGNDLNIADRNPANASLWQLEANRQKTIALWKQLATRYANEPYIGGYDIINEPNWGFADIVNDQHGLGEKGNAPLRQLMMDITAAIRSVDNNHMIIIEGNGWGNNYNGILPAWDKNMALSFHKYWNYNDSASIASIIDLRNKYQLPVWLGETGENSNVWFTEAIRLLEKNNIGWAWWPLKKMGANNPLQVRSNRLYESLLAYWNDSRRPQPLANQAYRGLMQLAADTRFENNIQHRDVIDAMMRQPFDNTAQPFKTNNITSGTVLLAVDYDLGSNGIAYFDTDTADYHIASQQPGVGNRGRVYRNDGVDISQDTSLQQPYYVSDIKKGEWLQYTLHLQQPALYNIEITVACASDSAAITLRDNQSILAGNIVVPNTGSLQKWQIIRVNNLSFAGPRHVFRIDAIKGGFNLLAFKFIAARG